MNKKQKKMLIRIIVAAILVVAFYPASDRRICKVRALYDPVSGDWL